MRLAVGYAWVRFRRIGFRRVRGHLQQARRAAAEHRPLQSTPKARLHPADRHDGAESGRSSHRNLMANACQLSRWSLGRSRRDNTGDSVLSLLWSVDVPVERCGQRNVVMYHRFRPASVVKVKSTGRR